ncbi:hypothetical protein TEA_003934 [Camellia sinensis var. sinensis]|uniref:ADP-ribosyl cyclase/cyclic ADP-ribose hydrolase n=1 Tax=Camellia sinensis var. sinensis TaxID=542762 RepID=A0A4S4E100_CAMSN|nr:hypothetical protein TEA_003934 [Camellia sinensis var. sinensis]
MAIVRSQETSSSNSHCSYDVFLSFRGEDTRKTFTDHLYTALAHAGFRTFRDDDGIERGENIKFELNKAIQESKISIVVFSEDYASSSWCLDELVMILERRRTVGHVVLPVFYHVDPSHVRKQKKSFKEAFTRHEERFRAEASDREVEWIGKVEEWKAALREAADLAGMDSQKQTDGLESEFIQKIVKVVGDKLSRTALGTDPHLIGIYSRAKNIGLWLQDESSDVRIVAICGMGGMGKTTIAKELYNSNFSRFEGSSFLANVREIVKQQDGLLRLQRQLLSDMLKGRKENLYNVDEGVVKIKNALCCKKVLVVLDDVDTRGQLDAILGMRDWLSQGSKIIITTRREQLLKAHEVCQVHKVEKLDNDESLELFSWHAFGKNYPINGFIEDSERVVQYCGGLPLAIKILGASLSGRSLNIWKSQLQKLKAIPNSEVIEKLKISYDSLQDDHDKNLFLHVACFFVGMDKDQVVTILDGCDFYTMVGIQNLIDRYLLTIDEHKRLVMHQLVQEMGREIVRQESPKEPGERSRVWNCKDSLNVLSENTGTRKIEGLKLDMKKSNQIPLEVDAFARMHKLKLLQLKYIQISGSFKNFPKGLRWLCWHGFPFKSIPHDFPLENLIVLDMSYSRLQIAWKGAKGCHEKHIFYAYCLGSKVPDWFNLKNEGSSVSFTVPSHLNFRIRCLSVCSIYALSNNRKEVSFNSCAHTIISNTTKSLIWSHSPWVVGIPEADEDMMMLSNWNFENQLESGDELNISVVGEEYCQVKEVGVHFVYKEQEEKSSQSSSEEASQQFSLYGNVVPGNASAPSCTTTSGIGRFGAVRLGEAAATGVIFYFYFGITHMLC